ncbi:GNAT family N-acetyltransferase, partial [Anaplasma marginale]|uniref:GNAT family N-acetyltransferase n=1 Tax=Anaplasma marginale TaxID=770 RepID=UPI0019D6FE3E
FYPHLNDDRRVWLQDGMVLPVKGYRENASKLLDRVLNFCFNNGISTVNLHVRVKNKRTQKFYAEKGGKYRANVYKWKI